MTEDDIVKFSKTKIVQDVMAREQKTIEELKNLQI